MYKLNETQAKTSEHCGHKWNLNYCSIRMNVCIEWFLFSLDVFESLVPRQRGFKSCQKI